MRLTQDGLRRLACSMPWWCWILYVAVAPFVLWVTLASKAYHWQIATDWYAARTTVWAIVGLLILAIVTAATVASVAEQAKEHAAGRGRRALVLIVCLLALGTIGAGIGVNMISTRIDRYIDSAEPSVRDFYHNADKTRLAAQAVRMIVLKERENTNDSAERATLKAIADHVPTAWMDLATESPGEDHAKAMADRALIDGTHEEGLAAFLFDRRREALDSVRWTALLARWTSESKAAPLPDLRRTSLAEHLRTTFATSLGEGLKLAYEHGDMAWPAMQIDMAVHLMEEAKRGVSAQGKEWMQELASLHDSANAIQGLIMTLDANAATRHAQTIDRFEQLYAILAVIKDTVTRMEAKIDELLELVRAKPGLSGLQAMLMDDELVALMKEMSATGDILANAIVEVASAANKFGPHRWDAADRAIENCLKRQDSRVDWTDKETFQLLLVKGDRLLFSDDPDGAIPYYREAIEKLPENVLARLRLASALQSQRRPTLADARNEARSLYGTLLAPVGNRKAIDATILNNLGLIDLEEGLYDSANSNFGQSLAIRKMIYGDKHASVTEVLTNQFALLYAIGDYDRAIELGIQIRDMDRDIHGEAHPDYARDLGNLAQAYTNKALFTEAEPLHISSLDIYEKALGSSHPNVALALNNLAAFYEIRATVRNELSAIDAIREDFFKAQALYKRSLAIRLSAFGQDHPDVAQSQNNLGGLLRQIGATYRKTADAQSQAKNYAEAEQLLIQALVTFRKVYGNNHLTVVSSLTNLATLYGAQARYQDADSMFSEALPISEALFGEQHEAVATILNNWADSTARFSQTPGEAARFADAEKRFLRSLAIFQQSLGSDHPNVATVSELIAKWLHTVNRGDEAKPFEKDAERIRSIKR